MVSFHYDLIKDNQDKTYAWFEKELDLSNLEKGTYSILVYTKASNAEDYGELSDIFGSINNAENTINNKNFICTIFFFFNKIFIRF